MQGQARPEPGGWSRAAQGDASPVFPQGYFISGATRQSGVPYAERDALRRSVTKPLGASAGMNHRGVAVQWGDQGFSLFAQQRPITLDKMAPYMVL